MKRKSLKFSEFSDEGIASPNEEFPVFYAERSMYTENGKFSNCKFQIYEYISQAFGELNLFVRERQGMVRCYMKIQLAKNCDTF